MPLPHLKIVPNASLISIIFTFPVVFGDIKDLQKLFSLNQDSNKVHILQLADVAVKCLLLERLPSVSFFVSLTFTFGQSRVVCSIFCSLDFADGDLMVDSYLQLIFELLMPDGYLRRDHEAPSRCLRPHFGKGSFPLCSPVPAGWRGRMGMGRGVQELPCGALVPAGCRSDRPSLFLHRGVFS